MREEQLFKLKDLIDNPAARLPVCLCLDTSSSMQGEKINELNKGIQLFYQNISEDEMAVYSAEICIVTFDSDVEIIQDFKTLDENNTPPTLGASGLTKMGEGVNKALDLLEDRKERYKEAGVDYYQPWLVLMTDGAPNGDKFVFKQASERTTNLVNSRKLTVFPIGIGSDANFDALKAFSPKFSPLKLKGLSFREFFTWLSQSVSNTSQSIPGDHPPLDKEGINEFSWKSWDNLDA